jgi:nucleotide-binding universal stress UspA family protein
MAFGYDVSFSEPRGHVMYFKKIFFPTDFSDSANHALRQAVELALVHKATLFIFHAVLLHADDPQQLKNQLKDYLDQLEKETKESLKTKSDELKGRGVAVEISTERSVSPFEAIMDKVNTLNPDLIVMGTHGRSGFGKLLLGSVAEKVLRHAPCHVMTLREDSAIAEGYGGFQRILVPVDFTDHSRRAFEVAQSLVSKDGSIVLVHVVASPIHPSFYAGGVTRLFQLDPELPKRIEESLLELLGDQAGEIVATEGDVQAEIMRVAEERQAQLIVIGTRGLSGIDHFLMGSVTEKVVRHSRIPVLTVK